MEGMTLKQLAKRRFFQLIEQRKEAMQRIDTEDGKRDFIVLSVQLHAAKANVPYRMHSLANK